MRRGIGSAMMALMAAGILAASMPPDAPVRSRRDEKLRDMAKKFDPADWREPPTKPTKRQARRQKGQKRRIID